MENLIALSKNGTINLEQAFRLKGFIDNLPKHEGANRELPKRAALKAYMALQHLKHIYVKEVANANAKTLAQHKRKQHFQIATKAVAKLIKKVFNIAKNEIILHQFIHIKLKMATKNAPREIKFEVQLDNNGDIIV